MTRKRMLALLLTVHWFEGSVRHFGDFFGLWDYVFEDNPLPKRKAKSKTSRRKGSRENNSDTHDE